jgi:hypothetical protein
MVAIDALSRPAPAASLYKNPQDRGVPAPVLRLLGGRSSGHAMGLDYSRRAGVLRAAQPHCNVFPRFQQLLCLRFKCE